MLIPVGARTRYVLLSIAIALVGLTGTEKLARAYLDQQQRELHEHHLMSASQMRSRLESSLNSTVFRAQGLVAYVVSVKTLEPAEADRMLKALYESDPRIRNVGLAPDNVIRFVYPHAGNDKAIGLRFIDRPDQWPDVLRAMQTRQSVLAGPVNLVQGGRAIICRTPVFLDDDRYWGTVSTVVDIDRLIQDVGLSNPDDGLRYTLYGQSGGQQGSHIFGRTGEDAPDAIRMTIEVPGGQWSLVSSPMAAPPASGAVWVVRIAMGSMSLMLGLFAFTMLSSRAQAEAIAKQLSEVNLGLAAANDELRRLSRRAPLTKLLNRRALEQAYEDAWQTCGRDHIVLSILMIDVDNFKTINDRFGHAAGDAALIDVATTIQSQLRQGNDVVARYGGEEFVVMALGLTPEALAQLAERIRAAVGRCEVRLPEGETSAETIAVSIGTASEIPTALARAQGLFQRADAALYQAKRSGRNQVVNMDRPITV